ncbi:MAG TPA: hypothetical protein VLE27_17770, partial [Thermoanaerobaculia bacterium]|nr:hypothetical protein [Thermoanaerobaculia bacterium]
MNHATRSPAARRLPRAEGRSIWPLTLLICIGLLAPGLLAAQAVCRSGDPCVLAMGGASGYPAPPLGCSSNYILEYKRRFLQSHFDNGTPSDFTDDPII